MSKEIVDNLVAKNYEALNKTVSEALLAKAIAKLDERKVEIASTFFNEKE